MKSGIFYFSGAGNSKAVAKEIANNLHANICKNMGETTQEDLEGLEQIGLVFPVLLLCSTNSSSLILKKCLRKRSERYSISFCHNDSWRNEFLRPLYYRTTSRRIRICSILY